MEHFAGRYEVELKFRVEDLNKIKCELNRFHAQEFAIGNHERDWYFEADEHRLETAGLSMILRQMSPAGIKLWIIKGPGKDRCEAVKVESISTAKNMLYTLGYRVSFELVKTRSIYFLDQFHITLDHIDGLGEYAEIAIMTDDRAQLDLLRESCQRCAKKLGLAPADCEPCSYRQLTGH